MANIGYTCPNCNYCINDNTLSTREKHILQQLVLHNRKEVAGILGISVKTVDADIIKINGKCSVMGINPDNKTIVALKLGLISFDDQYNVILNPID